MIIINRSSKDNATSQECKDTQKTPNALVVNCSDIGQSVFWIYTYPFTLPLLNLCYVSSVCLLPTNTKSILIYVTISVIWSS